MTARSQVATGYMAGTDEQRPRRGGVAGVVRTVLGFLLAACAGMSAVIAVTLTWLGRSLVDREGFTQLTDAVVQDPQVTDEVAQVATESAAQAADGIDTGGLPFGASLVERIKQFVVDVIDRYIGSSWYVEDWRQVLAQTYDTNIAAARDDAGAPGDLQIYVGALVDRIEQLLEAAVPFDIDLDLRSQEALGGPDGIITIQDTAVGPWIDRIVATADMAGYWWVGCLVLAVVALLIARWREWTVLGAGLGMLATSLIVGWIAQGVRDDVVGSQGLMDLARSVVQRVFDLLLDGLYEALVPWIWAGAITSVVGLLLIAARALWRSGGDRPAVEGAAARSGGAPQRPVIEA